MNRAVFLDRDGTVIVDRGYLDNADGVELLPTATAALKAMADAGFRLVLITNQSGVGRGRFAIDAVHAQHERLAELLQPHGVHFDLIKICPHAPDDACDCRKPKPKMILEAAVELDVDLAQSWMLGDKPSDVGAGKAAGCKTIGFGSVAAEDADFHADTMEDAARIIGVIG